ncbi:hypothetical protein BpHYR1_049674 [Brachionus plicatilis]|uniref:Zinc finger BED domain-containing 1-like n=1 Tax=Brachionus plicatilis TaxID=10195 RepID=A0A3M7QRN3_BRAPC|nr:hypothetical protein BpHYR1_049674 [Brachionus plicatilis]
MNEKSICLITDLWSNISAQQYLALAASMVFSNLTKKIRVIGMVLTNDSNADLIKECVETIISKFNFDKTEISGICYDQASALVRLFKQNENYLFDELIGQYLFNEIDREIQSFNDEEINFSIPESESENEIEVDKEEIQQVQSEIGAIETVSQTTEATLFNVNNVANTKLESDENIYEEDSDPINFLKIQLGTNSVPIQIFRYSCAAHNINLVIRTSIEERKNFSKFLAKLSKFAISIRNSNINSVDLISKKCKLRCENRTRWSSSYLML